MKGLVLAISSLTLISGCATQSVESITSPEIASMEQSMASADCLGSTALPAELAPYFDEVSDEALLQSTLGEPGKGGLCQGKVYQAKTDVTVPVFRAWNSTNPNSQFGNWWAFSKPAGLTAQYRTDYEICYQWSPLDKLVSCDLAPGTKIVVGNGQSAVCSQYLTYGKSASQQVYIAEAANHTRSCNVKDAVFQWQ